MFGFVREVCENRKQILLTAWFCYERIRTFSLEMFELICMWLYRNMYPYFIFSSAQKLVKSPVLHYDLLAVLQLLY